MREADSIDGLLLDIVRQAALLPGQRKAIVSLMLGNTPGAAARAGGVHRGTLYRWMKDDSAFAAVLAECKASVHADAREQLASLTGECVDLVYGAVVEGDKQMAYKLLRSMGVLTRQPFQARQKQAEAMAVPAGAISVDAGAKRLTGCLAEVGATLSDLSRGLFLMESPAEA